MRKAIAAAVTVLAVTACGGHHVSPVDDFHASVTPYLTGQPGPTMNAALDRVARALCRALKYSPTLQQHGKSEAAALMVLSWQAHGFTVLKDADKADEAAKVFVDKGTKAFCPEYS